MEYRQLLGKIELGLTDLYEAIDCVYPPSRERSMAVIKLDECLLWLGACEAEGGVQNESITKTAK